MTRQDAIAEIKYYMEHDSLADAPSNEACQMAIDALHALPNEWVRTKIQMPTEHEPVLCIVSGRPKFNIILEDAYQLGSWNKEDGWIIDEYLNWVNADVTWWMPLPAPPDRRPPEGETNV